jgi:hypothetical protein
MPRVEMTIERACQRSWAVKERQKTIRSRNVGIKNVSVP